MSPKRINRQILARERAAAVIREFPQAILHRYPGKNYKEIAADLKFPYLAFCRLMSGEPSSIKRAEELLAKLANDDR